MLSLLQHWNTVHLFVPYYCLLVKCPFKMGWLAAFSRTADPNFEFDTALPCVLRNIPAKCEVNWMNGCWDNQKTDSQTEILCISSKIFIFESYFTYLFTLVFRCWSYGSSPTCTGAIVFPRTVDYMLCHLIRKPPAVIHSVICHSLVSNKTTKNNYNMRWLFQWAFFPKCFGDTIKHHYNRKYTK